MEEKEEMTNNQCSGLYAVEVVNMRHLTNRELKPAEGFGNAFRRENAYAEC